MIHYTIKNIAAEKFYHFLEFVSIKDQKSPFINQGTLKSPSVNYISRKVIVDKWQLLRRRAFQSNVYRKKKEIVCLF